MVQAPVMPKRLSHPLIQLRPPNQLRPFIRSPQPLFHRARGVPLTLRQNTTHQGYTTGWARLVLARGFVTALF